MRNTEIVEIDLYRKEFKNMSDEGKTLASNFMMENFSPTWKYGHVPHVVLEIQTN